ncbi:MAG: hypothetical protein HY525_03660 [Betaproteobacteria bacterium]|nr:hypothetical protein [Betaproteobacteria bacterium]
MVCILMAPGHTAVASARDRKRSARVHALPDLRERYANLGIEATSSTAAEFAAYIKADAAGFAKVLKETGVKLD